MAQRVISGAHIKIWINGTVYNEAQQLSYSIDYGEEPIYGIDSIFPQEIKITRISVTGNISGVRIANSNGLQGYNIRSGIRDSQFAPYISIRIQDNRTEEDILFIPHARIVNEKVNVSAKGIVTSSFAFSGLQPLQPLDRAK
jgi:hypothetical protein